MTNKENKQKKNRLRHQFLLTFFSDEEVMEVQEVNGFVLMKQFHKDYDGWCVSIHTKSGWEYYLKTQSSGE